MPPDAAGAVPSSRQRMLAVSMPMMATVAPGGIDGRPLAELPAVA
jgi:hypothetical protein